MTKVVNLRYEPYDTYAGRGSIFGNDWTHISNKKTLAKYVVKTREESIEKYREYFLKRVAEDAEFKAEVMKLKDKRLGCYCAPLACHCDIIKEWLDSQK